MSSGGSIVLNKQPVDTKEFLCSGYVRITVDEDNKMVLVFPNGSTAYLQSLNDSEPLYKNELNTPFNPVTTDKENNKLPLSSLLPNVELKKNKDKEFVLLNNKNIIPRANIPNLLENKNYKGIINGYIPLNENSNIENTFLSSSIQMDYEKGKINGYLPLNSNRKVDRKYIKNNAIFTDVEEAFNRLIIDSVYPVGSVYINFYYKSSPKKILGFGNWKYIGGGNMIVAAETPSSIKEPLSIETTAFRHELVITVNDNITGIHRHAHGFEGSGSSGLYWAFADESKLPEAEIVASSNITKLGNRSELGEYWTNKDLAWYDEYLPASVSGSSYTMLSSGEIVLEEGDPISLSGNVKALKAYIWYRLPDDNNYSSTFNKRGIDFNKSSNIEYLNDLINKNIENNNTGSLETVDTTVNIISMGIADLINYFINYAQEKGAYDKNDYYNPFTELLYSQLKGSSYKATIDGLIKYLSTQIKPYLNNINYGQDYIIPEALEWNRNSNNLIFYKSTTKILDTSINFYLNTVQTTDISYGNYSVIDNNTWIKIILYIALCDFKWREFISSNVINKVWFVDNYNNFHKYYESSTSDSSDRGSDRSISSTKSNVFGG